MKPTQPKQFFASTKRSAAYGGGIEWEELPSMSRRVALRPDFGPTSGFGVTWEATMPAGLDELRLPSPQFSETLSGLATREVIEPDVFEHFFGANPVIETNER